MWRNIRWDAPDQGTDEWLRERRGMVTGSIQPRLFGIYGCNEQELAEEVCGLREPVFTPWQRRCMRYGTENEDTALEGLLSVLGTDCVLDRVGFQRHPYFSGLGCSVDGLLTLPDGRHAVVEAKCTMQRKGFPAGATDAHRLQIAFNCMVIDALSEGQVDTAYWVGYAPGDRVWVQEIPRNRAMEEAVLSTSLQFDAVLDQYRQRMVLD